jgi:hypothetical protein
VDWNGQENFSLSCELWVGTNDFNTKKNSCPFQSTDNFPEWKLAFTATAPRHIRETIVKSLLLYKPVFALANLDRRNIYIRKKNESGLMIGQL